MSTPKHCYRRLVYQYDPLLGYRFVPNLYARISRPGNTFVIQTNKQGFRDDRSFDERLPNRPTVLALGDSFLAGDGISNHERFMDILAARLSFNVMNAGLPGSGSDQQLLIQERVAEEHEYDALVLVPFAYNIRRNLRDRMRVLDWISRKPLDIRKPYFELVDGELQLRNTPVPLAKDFFLRTVDPRPSLRSTAALTLRAHLPRTHRHVKRAREWWETFAHRLRIKRADSDYAEAESYPWRLMRAIFERMIRNAGSRPVVIIPMPLPAHVLHDAHPFYLERFQELASDHVFVIDVLPALRAGPRERRKRLFIPDGHFSARANDILAEFCQDWFETWLGKQGARPQAPARTSRDRGAAPRARYVLGVSCFYHDSAGAVIRNGRIVAAAQEERFTRVKHDKSFPLNAINYCLEQARLDPERLDAVVYYDDERLTLERMLATQVYLGSRSAWLPGRLPEWVATKFSIWQHIRRELNYQGPLYRALHHRSHAASAFYPSPFTEAAIVTVDGVGEWATTTVGVGEGNAIRILKEQRFPHSLGLLYSAFTAFCGFKVNSGEYKLMGLAPYGRPRFRDTILRHLLDVREDGSYALNLKYFAFLSGERMTNRAFEELFEGPPRVPESRITQRECDLAASIQAVTEEVMLRICRYAYELTRKRHLTLAGGVALNCVANGKILKQGPFERIWIQPAAGDAGGAVGAALDLWYSGWGNPRSVGDSDQADSCFGPEFSSEEIRAFLDFHQYRYHTLDPGRRAEAIAELLQEGKVVGHFSGRMEYGPRALGARSILADPRQVEMQRTLNLKIKYRESFRPFAPIVLEEEMRDYFDLNTSSPYMLLVAPVQEAIRKSVPEQRNGDLLTRLRHPRSTIPAVTHVDCSARVQTVARERYPLLYEILVAFRRKTGCSVLVNTSFNVRGEPIVCTPEDAYRCFMRTEMDALVMNEFLLKKEEQPPWREEHDWRKVYELD